MSRLTQTVDIILDKPRKLRFGFNAWSEYEEAMDGATMTGLFWKIMKAEKAEKGSAATVLGVRELRAMLWAGLRHEDPSLTLVQVGELLEFVEGDSVPEKILTLTPILMKAWNISQGEPKGKKNEPSPRESPDTTGGT